MRHLSSCNSDLLIDDVIVPTIKPEGPLLWDVYPAPLTAVIGLWAVSVLPVTGLSGIPVTSLNFGSHHNQKIVSIISMMLNILIRTDI